MKVIGNLTKDAIIRAAVSEGLTVTQAVGSKTVTFEQQIFLVLLRLLILAQVRW